MASEWIEETVNPRWDFHEPQVSRRIGTWTGCSPTWRQIYPVSFTVEDLELEGITQAELEETFVDDT